MTLSLKSKTIISIVLFVLLVGSMLVLTALTDVDLTISDILTANALEDDNYLATDFFGVMFELIGTSAIYFVAAFCIVVMFWYTIHFIKLHPLREIFAVIFFVAGIVAFWFYMNDILGYTGEHLGEYIGSSASDIRLAKDFAEGPAYMGVAIVTALLMNCMAMFCGKSIKPENIKKLVKFVFAFLIMAAVSNLLVEILKGPVGRMRYRAMNSEYGQSIGGFDNFTRWWQMTDNNDVYTSEQCVEYFGAKDAFKSFPSGHTCAAGMSYALIMLIDVLDIKNKWAKFGIWASSIAMTMIVAISRIVVGAHFFSDVLMGGTLAFTSMILAREIVICKFSHIKAMFGKSKGEMLA